MTTKEDPYFYKYGRNKTKQLANKLSKSQKSTTQPRKLRKKYEQQNKNGFNQAIRPNH